MYNRKFNIKKDFSELNELENVMLPKIRYIKNTMHSIILEDYIKKIFFNQYKK